MVRLKSTPKKRYTQNSTSEDIGAICDILTGRYDDDPRACDEVSHKPSTKCPINWLREDITVQKVCDSNWIVLSKQLLLSFDTLSLLDTRLECHQCEMILTCTTNKGTVCFQSVCTPSIIGDIKRMIRKDSLCFSCFVEGQGRLFLTVSVRADPAAGNYSHSFFLSPEIFRWITGTSCNGEEIGATDTFSSQLLLQTVTQHSTHSPCSSASSAAACKSNLRRAGLLPELRDYQLQGVLWMAQREGHSGHGDVGPTTTVGADLQGWQLLPKHLPSLWRSEKSTAAGLSWVAHEDYSGSNGEDGERGGDVWLNCITGEGVVLTSTGGESEGGGSQWMPSSDALIRGGILADEPGLGKTVELLGLILLHSPNTHPEDPSHAEDVFVPGEGGEGEGEESSVCVCMRETFHRKLHQGWVQCDHCQAYSHITCAGFASEAEAAACERYECLICTCLRLASAPLRSGSTLVVVPGSLLGQWEREIRRHTDPSLVTYIVYLGLRHAEEGPAREAPSRLAALHPRALAAATIVLTSFEVLAAELHRSDSPFAGHGKPNYNSTRKFFDPVDVSCPRALRSRKKYRFAPSPLLGVHWGRVCLDEAQLVEGTTTAAARMAQKLHTEVRWCVSGTPVGSGQLEDLFGLFLFLQQRPLCNRHEWKQLIVKAMQGPAPAGKGDGETARQSVGMARLQAICCKLMLRRSKESVSGQLRLPPQEQKVRHLVLGPVERHFYHQQHEECLRTLRESASQETDVALLSTKLLVLRQAACHPQLGSRGIGGTSRRWKAVSAGPRDYQVTNKGIQVMTMDEVLCRLIDGARLSCEEGQRKLIMSYCAAAGVLRIKSHLLEVTDGAASCSPTAALHFLTSARKLYQSAMDTYTGNRKESLVISHISVASDTEGLLRPAILERQRADSVCCLWTTSSQALCTALGSSSFIPIDSAGIGSDECYDRAKRCRVDLSISLEREFDSESSVYRSANVDPATPPEGKHIALQRVIPCKLDLIHPRRLVACRVSHDIMKSVYTLRKRGLCPVTVPQGEVEGPTAVPSTALCGVVLFPALFTIQCQVSTATALSGDILYSDVHRFGTDFDDLRSTISTSLATGIAKDCWTHTGNFCASSQRTRSWRMVIESFFDYALAVYSCQCQSRATESHPNTCLKCCRVVNLASYLSEDSVEMVISAQLRLYEAEFDVDLLQELHVTENYRRTMEALVSITESSEASVSTPVKRPLSAAYSPPSHNHHDDSDYAHDALRRRSELLKQQYVSLAAQAKAEGRLKLEDTTFITQSALSDLERDGGWGWLDDVLYLIGGKGHLSTTESIASRGFLEEELMRSIHAAVDSNGQAYTCLAGRLTDGHSLLMFLHDSIRTLLATRKAVVEAVLGLPDSPSPSDMAENSQCRRCRADWGQRGSVCKHCKLEDKISDLERCLRSFLRQSKDRSSRSLGEAVEVDLDGQEIRDVQREAFEVDGPAVFLAKIVWRFLGTHQAKLHSLSKEAGQSAGAVDCAESIRVGAVAMEVLSGMQKEIQPLRLAWRQHLQCLSALDEVQQAARPLQLLTAEELVTSSGGSGIGVGGEGVARLSGYIFQGEEDERLAEFLIEVEAAKTNLASSVGQLHYLVGLASSSLPVDDSNPALTASPSSHKECVICMEELSAGDCVMISCGHVFHQECLGWVMQRAHVKTGGGGDELSMRLPAGRTFKCPMCRKTCRDGDVLLTRTKAPGDCEVAEVVSDLQEGKSEDESSPVELPNDIQGQWGVKVGALIADLLQLVRTGEKAIVFSQWEQMLDIIAAALQTNGIKFEKIVSKKLFDRCLVRFTCDPSVTVLLLPLKSGAQGLTVVEANHVFFVEPMLNLEQEQQAMNRIHRIGQTRSTFVHRYIVHDTVEIKIHEKFLKRYEASSEEPCVAPCRRLKATDDQSMLTLNDISYLFDHCENE